MHVISKKALRVFWEKHADSQISLMRWFKLLKHNSYNSFSELREVFPSADMVDDLIVFNIGGNKYRLIASIHFNYPHFQTESGQLNFHHNKDCILLIAENVSNPDNLGMLLRTADAAGISGILLCGEGASPVHKNTIRAARGAIGRLPIFHASDTIMAIELLKETGWQVIGATATGDTDLYNLGFKPNTAIIVGNEYGGLSDGTRQHCTELIRLPMAPGQSSLNVGVAAGIFLYEIMRHRIVHE